MAAFKSGKGESGFSLRRENCSIDLFNNKDRLPADLEQSAGLNLIISRLLYVRHSFGFAIFLDGSKLDVKHILSKIQAFMNTEGLALNLEKVKINNTCQNFSFKGAICKRVSRTSLCSLPPKGKEGGLHNLFKTPPTVPGRGAPGREVQVNQRESSNMVMHMDMDLRVVYKYLVDSKYARFSKNNPRFPLGTANNTLLNLPHKDILELYNVQVLNLTMFYSFVAVDRNKLSRIS